MTAKSGSASCLASGEGQQAAGTDQPEDQGEQRSRPSLQPGANEEMADGDAVARERDRARRHRTALQSCVVSTVPVQGDAERSKRDGGRRCEKAGEALGRRTSPRMAKADTTTPPTRKRTTYSVISLSSRVSTVAHRSRRPDPCAAGAPSKWS